MQRLSGDVLIDGGSESAALELLSNDRVNTVTLSCAANDFAETSFDVSTDTGSIFRMSSAQATFVVAVQCNELSIKDALTIRKNAQEATLTHTNTANRVYNLPDRNGLIVTAPDVSISNQSSYLDEWNVLLDSDYIINNYEYAGDYIDNYIYILQGGSGSNGSEIILWETGNFALSVYDEDVEDYIWAQKTLSEMNFGYSGTLNLALTPLYFDSLPAYANTNKKFRIIVGNTITIDGESKTFPTPSWAHSDGTTWNVIENTEHISTVHGRIGDITANYTDYTTYYADKIHTHNLFSIAVTFSNTVIFSNTTSSTSTITGAVIVGGGLGVTENVNIGGTLTTTGSVTFNGQVSTTGPVRIGLSSVAASGIEIGNVTGTTTTPYLDFHSSGNNIDYDFRLVASGGTGSVGGGLLSLIGTGGININGPTAHTKVLMNRAAGNACGQKWYNSTHKTWQNYMANVAANQGYDGDITPPNGTYVTSYALRSFIENTTGYGWTWESGISSSTTPTLIAELSSATGNFKTKGLVSSDSQILAGITGKGIKVDTATPTYPWRDLEGMYIPDPGGVNAPSLITYQGLVREYAYTATDKIDCRFHIPHDYVPGTDLYIHAHWSHIGTAISGNMVMSFAHSYAKGHNQANFSAPKTVAITYATVDIATTPQYRHRIDEVQLSSSGGSATLLDSALIEVDGLLLINLTVTGIPTITGANPNNEPFIHCIDLHYQSTGIGTKNKAPAFYSAT